LGKQITLSEKLNVIQKVKVKTVTWQVEVAKHLGFSPSSLSRIMLKKNKIIEGKIKCGAH
jgi:hypothetical protein